MKGETPPNILAEITRVYDGDVHFFHDFFPIFIIFPHFHLIFYRFFHDFLSIFSLFYLFFFMG